MCLEKVNVKKKNLKPGLRVKDLNTRIGCNTWGFSMGFIEHGAI
jgi:hypothetical protein